MTTAILRIARQNPLILNGVISLIRTADITIEINQESPTLNYIKTTSHKVVAKKFMKYPIDETKNIK